MTSLARRFYSLYLLLRTNSFASKVQYHSWTQSVQGAVSTLCIGQDIMDKQHEVEVLVFYKWSGVEC